MLPCLNPLHLSVTMFDNSWYKYRPFLTNIVSQENVFLCECCYLGNCHDTHNYWLKYLPTAYVVRGKVCFDTCLSGDDSVCPHLGRCTPARSRQGGVHQWWGTHPRLDLTRGATPMGGTPSWVPPVRPGWGVPEVGYSLPAGPGRGVPWWGYPTLGTPVRPGWGVPQLGVPHLGYPPHRTWPGGYPNGRVPHLE